MLSSACAVPNYELITMLVILIWASAQFRTDRGAQLASVPLRVSLHVCSLSAVPQVVLSLDELIQLPGKGRFGTFLHNITKFYYTYHQCARTFLPAPTCRQSCATALVVSRCRRQWLIKPAAWGMHADTFG